MTWFRRLLTFTLLAAILVASLSWALWPRPAITLTLTGLTENLTVRTQSRGSPGDVPELLIVYGLRENEVRLIRGDTLAGSWSAVVCESLHGSDGLGRVYFQKATDPRGPHGTMSSMVAFIPASGDDRSLFRLEPGNESPVSVVTVPCEKFQSSKLSADRSTFVTAHGDDETPTTVRVYDLPGGTLRRTISFPDRRGSFCPRDTLVACMSWHLSGDGKTLYMAEAWDGTKRITPAGIDVIDTVTGALVRRIDVSARTIARAPSPPLLLQSDDVGVYFLSPFCGDDGLRFDLSRRGRSFEVGAGSAPTTTTNIV